MAFAKNWIAYIVSQGEPFTVDYLDRTFGKRKIRVFEISDVDGSVNITGALNLNGVALTGDQTVVGTVQATVDVDAGQDVNSTRDVNVGRNLNVTDVSTFTGLAKLPAASFLIDVTTGHNGAGAVTLTGAKVGDKVIGVANLTVPADLKSSFETTITVTDQIQQSSATDLSSTKVQVILLHQS